MTEERLIWFAGVDWGSQKHQARLLDAAGVVVGEREFPHGGSGLALLWDLPHFPDPDAFLREAFRVLRSGGRVAFSAWAPAQECIGFGMIYSAVQAHGRMDVALPPGPNFFLFGDPAQCERSLEAAGFLSVTVTKVPLVWRVASPDEPVEVITKGTVRAAALLRAQAPDALAAIRDAVRQAVGAFARNGAFELMMPAVVATAEKP